MAKIAVVGPGAVGCSVAAWLTKRGGHELSLCARTPVERLEVDTPDGKLHAAPRVFTSPEQAETVDWVLVTTKAYDAAGAASWFGSLLGPHTRLCILQNGVEHVERFALHAPVERIVPVIVDCPAERSARSTRTASPVAAWRSTLATARSCASVASTASRHR